MRYLIALIVTVFILMAMDCSAQKVDSIPKQMDSIAIKDIYRLWDSVKDKVTAKQSEDFAGILQYILVTANNEFIERQKAKKK